MKIGWFDEEWWKERKFKTEDLTHEAWDDKGEEFSKKEDKDHWNDCSNKKNELVDKRVWSEKMLKGEEK